MKRPNKYIKFSGLGVYWTDDYAKIYKEKLDEIGFYARILKIDSKGISHSSLLNKELVAYSHRDFTEEDAFKALFNILREDYDSKE